MAPAFGAEDHQVARAEGLEMVNPIGSNGHFLDEVPLVGGMFFKGADPTLVEDLQQRGVLFRVEEYEHSYPHCWRCHTPLIYYALPSWFIRTTEIRDRLLAENEGTNWYPPHIKHGRYGAWLENNVDWALSRKRYWGTPLPVWRNDADPTEIVVVGSLAELGSYAGEDLSNLDPHRPYVDDVTFPAPSGTGTMRRVPDVIDVWYDSGAMPFAQWGAPHRNEAEFEAAYPAQYICEAIDQTRGWFYSLMAIGTLVFDRSSYENVVCLGLLLDEHGRKMSKHLGNVLDPFELFSTHGADAVRWLMLAQGSPWVDRRVGHETLREIVRKVLLTYWNTASFLVTYANAAGWTPSDPAPTERTAMDRWALGELRATVAEVTEALDDFDSSRAGRAIVAFVDDLSNWYVRRSRRRFWSGDPAALATLHECVETVSRLMAPFIPFTTDYLWTLLQGEGGTGLPDGSPDSVHLAPWPEVKAVPDEEARLRSQMALVRSVVELGRSTRAASGVRTRQPLSRAVVSARGFADLADTDQGRELLAEIAEELNVARGRGRGLRPRRDRREAELPRAGQAVRQADAHRGRRREGLVRRPGRRGADGDRRRVAGRAVRRRDPRVGEPPRGLGRALGGRPVGGARHRADRRAARGRPAPRRPALRAGRPQAAGLRGVRPDRAVVERVPRRHRDRGPERVRHPGHRVPRGVGDRVRGAGRTRSAVVGGPGSDRVGARSGVALVRAFPCSGHGNARTLTGRAAASRAPPRGRSGARSRRPRSGRPPGRRGRRRGRRSPARC